MITLEPKEKRVKEDSPKSYLIIKGKDKEFLESLKEKLGYSWNDLVQKMIEIFKWYINHIEEVKKIEERDKKK